MLTRRRGFQFSAFTVQNRNNVGPSPESLKNLDGVVIDLQDVGVRFFTYEVVVGYFLEAAAQAHVEIILLDRPNPIGGIAVQGPVSDAGAESYNNYMPMPVRNGMTLGELALYFNSERLLAMPLHLILGSHTVTTYRCPNAKLEAPQASMSQD